MVYIFEMCMFNLFENGLTALLNRL